MLTPPPPPASPRVVLSPGLRVVRSDMARRRGSETGRSLHLGSVLMICALVLALLQVWLRLQVAEVGYRLEDTRQFIERLRFESSELAAEAARIDHAAAIERMARERLSLQRPSREQEARLP